MKTATATIALALCVLGSAACAESLANPDTLCNAIKNTGMASDCTVSNWHETVDMSVDTTGLEAIKMCKGTISLILAHKLHFGEGWKLRILSPFSGDKPLATCDLP